MLWGCIVSEGKPYALPADSEYELLHISNAALSKASEPGKAYLMITKGKETFTVAVLQKDKVETVLMDIYVRTSQNVKLTVSGKGEVHVTGYFEPTEEVDKDAEEAFLEGALGEEEDESESEEEKKPAPKKEEKKPEPKKVAEKKVEAKKPVEEKKPEPKKVEEKKPEPKKAEEKKPKEAVKPEQFGGKKAEASESDEEDLLGEEEDMGILGSSDEDEEIEEDKLKKMVAEKKRAADKPLAPKAESKKPKGEVPTKEAGGQAPKPAQGEGKKKKKHKKKHGKPQPQ